MDSVTFSGRPPPPPLGRDFACGLATPYMREVPGCSAPVQTGPEGQPASYTMGTGSFPGVKRSGRGIDHLPHLAQKLKKEYRCTSIPPLGLQWPVKD